ncbi:SH3 domain-containing protein [Vibrio alginolyticus]|uniref:SH3 domain-containing protein n=2 Tax=Vibrio harveyi group TaxID=717610 RepID=UPI00354BC63B
MKDIVDNGSINIDSDVKRELEQTIFQGKSADSLSDKALNTIIWLLKNFFLPLLVSCIATAYMEQSDFVRDFFSAFSTDREIKSEIRKQTFDNNKKNLRVIIGNNLNLREGPAQKNNSLGLLHLGDVIEVLDSTNRSWLYVRVVVDEEVLTGWIFRRYSKKLNYVIE